MMITKILNLFRRKEEQVPLPSRFALIRFTEHAKKKGIFDDENKVIEIYNNGKPTRPILPYSEELVKSIEEVDEIPVVEEIFEEEPFEFEEVADFGSVEYRR